MVGIDPTYPKTYIAYNNLLNFGKIAV